MKLSFSPFAISERTTSDCYHSNGLKSANLVGEKLFGAEILSFRPPLGAAPVGSRAMPWRGVWGRNGARRGRRARVPPPARAASRREQLSQPCRGSSRQFRGPSNRSHSSAACATRRRRRPAAAMIGLGETREHPSCWRSTQGGRL